MNEDELDLIKKMISTYEQYLIEKNLIKFTPFQQSVQKLIVYLLGEYACPENHENPEKHRQENPGRLFFRDAPRILQTTFNKNEDTKFLSNHSYISSLLTLYYAIFESTDWDTEIKETTIGDAINNFRELCAEAAEAKKPKAKVKSIATILVPEPETTLNLYGNNQMFSKLVFVVEGERIEFQAHELVKVVQKLIKAQPTADISAPAYSEYNEILMHNFLQFTQELSSYYAWGAKIDSNELFDFLIAFYHNPAQLLRATTWTRYSEIVAKLKRTKPETAYTSGEKNPYIDLILPPLIKEIRTAEGWLSLARYAANKTPQELLAGWWVNIGNRLILLQNNPAGREHLYVSDHGFTQNVMLGVKKALPKFDAAGREQMLYAFKFHRYYSRLTDEEKKFLKDHFVIMLQQGHGGDEEKNEFLMYVLSLPKSQRESTLTSGRLDAPYRNAGSDIGNRHDLYAAPEEALKTIDSSKHEEYDQIFEHTLEHIRYSAVVITRTFVETCYESGLNPFFTQVDNLFNLEDADCFKTFFILSEVAKALGKGTQYFLFRPAHSFGSRDEGESYRGFANALTLYFTKHAALSERQLATEMRAILQGGEINNEQLYFLPNLVAAWFVSEVSRNESAFMSGLMLLDLMESGIELPDADKRNLYSWKHVLLHPNKPKHSLAKVNIKDLYGEAIDLSRFDGLHPMAHAGSVQDAKATLGKNTKLTPVRQKEGHLIIHWLFERMRKNAEAPESRLVIARPKEESTAAQECCLLNKETTDYGEIDQLLEATGKASNRIRKDSRLNKKWKILHKFIIPYLKERMQSLGNLIEPHSAKITETPSISAASAHPSIIMPHSVSVATDEDILAAVKKESMQEAIAKGEVGPREIPDWDLQDVDDRGNCFYDATIRQMQIYHHPFLAEVPAGTLAPDVLRLRIQGENFKDQEWADNDEIIKLARDFHLTVAIVDTRTEQPYFIAHYIDDAGSYQFTNDPKLVPTNRLIIRLAFTGAHYMSVIAHPSLSIGAIREPFHVVLFSIMREQVSLIFLKKLHDQFLITNRHDTPTAQEEYDKKFGLIIRNE